VCVLAGKSTLLTILKHYPFSKMSVQSKNGERELKRQKYDKYRGKDDVITRLWYNLRLKCRSKKLEEGYHWTVEDVKELLHRTTFITEKYMRELQEGTRRITIIPVDKDKPFTLDNAKIIPFGGIRSRLEE
jgi:hypothetical protein